MVQLSCAIKCTQNTFIQKNSRPCLSHPNESSFSKRGRDERCILRFVYGHVLGMIIKSDSILLLIKTLKDPDQGFTEKQRPYSFMMGGFWVLHV